MCDLNELFENNRRWADACKQAEPWFFRDLAAGQSPSYLWIGCSDSRIPPNEVVGLRPGQMFVHRNIANLVCHTDLNCMSVLQYAVEVLKVKHVIICGHYGCGGVKAAMTSQEHGLIDNWLRQIKDILHDHQTELGSIVDEEKRFDRVCELNIARQVANVCHTTIVQDSWAAGHELTVHGVIFGLADGLLHDLNIHVSGPETLDPIYRMQPRSHQ